MILELSVFCLTAWFTVTKVAHQKNTMGWMLRETNFKSRSYFHGLVSVFAGALMKSYNKFDKIPNKKGCTAVITGGGKGIGRSVIKSLAKTGMHVVAGVRNPESCKDLAEEIKNENPEAKIDFLELDVSSLSSVKNFSEIVKRDHKEIHLLINNAGVIDAPQGLTKDGFEIHLATNYIGHFLLTHLLMENLKLAGSNGPNCSRIVNVSSCAHTVCPILYDDINFKESFHPEAAYGQSKLAQLMFSRYLDREFQTCHIPIRSIALHPGLVDTQMTAKFKKQKNLVSFVMQLMKSPEEGSTTVLYCCFSEDLEQKKEQFISDCRPYYSTQFSKSEQEQKKLFDYTTNLLKIKNFGIVEG